MKLTKKNIEHIKNYFNITYGIIFSKEEYKGNIYYVYEEWWNDNENKFIHICIDPSHYYYQISLEYQGILEYDIDTEDYDNYKEVIEQLKEWNITSPTIQQYRRDKYIQELLN
jgi:hypothetical protein